MTFLNPLAWIGLAVLAVPVLIHLLGRRPPVPLPFPTLRFLDATRELPARRHRLNDVPLLIVRIAVLAVGVAALAQPRLPGPARPPAGGSPARAIVLDTSASMARPSTTGRSAQDVARDLVASQQTTASVARTFETATVPSALAGAGAWLSEQAGPHEVVVISDFQAGTIAAADLASVPPGTGLRLMPVTVDASSPVERSVIWGNVATVARVDATAATTSAAWRPSTPSAGLPPFIEARVADAERADLDRSISAARLEGVPASTSGRPVVLIFAGAPGVASQVADFRRLDEPWMFDIVAAISSDETVTALASRLRARGDAKAVARPAADRDDVFVPVARDRDGRPRVRAAATSRDALAMLVDAPPADAVSAAIISVAWRHAATPPVALAEHEPNVIPDATLRAWERAPDPAAAPPSGPRDRSDGRWLWAAVLILLAVEWRMRRRPAQADSSRQEVPRARVA